MRRPGYNVHMTRIVASLLVALALATAQAQEVSVLPPTDRFVRPGDTVTLTFELVADEAVDVDLDASTTNAWPIVVEPLRMSLEQDVAAEVTVTVEVPTDAPAITTERVTLRVIGVEPVIERAVELNVLEVVDLRLDAPPQAPLGVEGLRATVANAGNSTRQVTAELRRDDVVLASRSLTLAPGVSIELRFDLVDEGDHVLQLVSPGAAAVRRTVRAIRFGAPDPAPFRLAGSVTSSYGLGGDWEINTRLRGRLSDFTSLDVLAIAPTYRRSYVQIDTETTSVRIGAGGAAPFGLDLPRDLGLAASYESDGLGVGGRVGVTASDELSAFAAASWSGPDFAIAAGGGVRADDPVAALRSTYTRNGLTLGLTGRYQQARLNARLTADIREGPGTTNLRVEARDVLTDRSRLDFEVRYRTGPTAVYGNLTAPLGDRATWAWRTGLTQGITTTLPGALQLAIQAGSTESFARVSYRVTIADEWLTTNVLGVRYDTRGFGLTLDSSWTLLGIDDLSLNTRLTYRPGPGTIDGQVGAKLQVTEDPVSLALDGAWNLTNRTLGANVALSLFEGPWSFDVDASARYAYTRTTDPWTFDLGIALTYTFDVTLPDDVVEAAGGRRLGTLTGTVRADGRPLADVVLTVGRFRVITDEEGTFEIQVPPGTYRVSVDRVSVPSGYRVEEPTEVSVEVVLRETREVAFVLVRTGP